MLLKLTEQGQEVTLELHARLHEYEDRLIEGIDAGELELFYSVVSKIMDNSFLDALEAVCRLSGVSLVTLSQSDALAATSLN